MLTKKAVTLQMADFISLREGIETSSAVGKMVFTFLAAVSEFEAALIRERVQAGVDRAKAKGVLLGPLAMLDSGESLKETARALSVSRNTLRRRLREHGRWP